MRTCLISAMILSLCRPANAQERKPLKPWIITAAVAATADIARTHYDLRRGATESNPLIPSTPVANSVALVSSYAIGLTIAYELNAHGHDKAARLFTAGIATDASLCVAHNFRLFRW